MKTKQFTVKKFDGELKEKDQPELTLTKEELEERYKHTLGLPALLNWKSPLRPFHKRSRQYFTTAGIVTLVFILVSVLLQWWMLIGVVLTLLFLAYVLGTVEPEVVEHKITIEGIISAEKVYLWRELSGFWFDKYEDQNLLVLETKKGFPPRLVILLGFTTSSAVSNLLAKYIPVKKNPPQDFLDKLARNLRSWFPLEG